MIRKRVLEYGYKEEADDCRKGSIMLKTVLVPLDGSQLAEEALEHALNLVEPQGKIVLVSAVEVPEVPIYGYYPPTAGPDYEDVQKNLLPYAKDYLNSIAERLADQHLEVAMQTEIGDPAEIITLAAQKFHVDAIVMSTHGRSGISRWLFGSVTNKVLGNKPCPVYVIPSREPVAEKV